MRETGDLGDGLEDGVGGQPKRGDHGTCSRCGDELTLEAKIGFYLADGTPSVMHGRQRETLQWVHSGPWVPRDHAAELGGPA